jgi:protein CpxP
MNRFRSLILVMMAAVLAAGVAFAQGPGLRGRGAGGPGPGFGLPLRELNLTDAQREQVRTLSQQSREQNRAAFEKLRTAMEAQRHAVETVPVNEALIRSTAGDLAEAQAEVAIQQAHLRADVIALLTPEQQGQLKKLQTERASRRPAERSRQQRQQNNQN